MTIYQLIDMRSFTTLWYWIALMAFWYASSTRVLGVPYDMVQTARRHGGEAEAEMTLMARIGIARQLHMGRTAGHWIVAFAMLVLTMLFMLGFFYRLELAQAVFLIALPMALVALIRFLAARSMARRDLEGPALARSLARLRMGVQVLGMVFIFITALWGMWHTLTTGVLRN